MRRPPLRSLAAPLAALAAFFSGCGPTTSLSQVDWTLQLVLDEDFETAGPPFRPTDARIFMIGLPQDSCVELSGFEAKVNGEERMRLVSNGGQLVNFNGEIIGCELPAVDHVFFRRDPPEGSATYSFRDGDFAMFFDVANAYAERSLALTPPQTSLSPGQTATFTLSPSTDTLDVRGARIVAKGAGGETAFTVVNDGAGAPISSDGRTLSFVVPAFAGSGPATLEVKTRIQPGIEGCDGAVACRALIPAALSVGVSLSL